MIFNGFPHVKVLPIWGLLIVVLLLGAVAFSEQVGLLDEKSPQDEGALSELTRAVKLGDSDAAPLDATGPVSYLTTLNDVCHRDGATPAPRPEFYQRTVVPPKDLLRLHSTYRI